MTEETKKEPASVETTAGEAEQKKPDLEKQLDECQKQKDEYLAGWQRERADFLNYKKEEMERIGEILKYAGEEIVLNLLPILDNFEISEKNLPENLKKDENIKGLLQIKSQVSEFLKNQGVEEIKTIGEKFDPRFHEVVGEIESSEALAKEGKKAEPGTIVEEIQKGYKINNKILRVAKVKITK
jgi:molecular chaperone GrpE